MLIHCLHYYSLNEGGKIYLFNKKSIFLLFFNENMFFNQKKCFVNEKLLLSQKKDSIKKIMT
jgi:hypothetical protein